MSEIIKKLAILIMVVFPFSEGLAAECHSSIQTLENWEFLKGDAGGVWEALRIKNSSKLPAYEKVKLPHCFNATDAVNPYEAYYQGPGWYRTTVNIDNPYPDGRIVLRFDGAGQKTQLYVQDSLIGEHVGGYDEFQFDITDAVKKHAVDGRITLVVRCDNSRDLEMIPSDLSDFSIYGGLYRPVHLIYRPAVGATWPQVDCSVDEKGVEGSVFFKMEVFNPLHRTGNLELKLEIFDAADKLVLKREKKVEISNEASFSFSAQLSNPELWSPSTPNLYRWKITTATGAADTMHSQGGRFGFRNFRFEKKGPFFLNGERLLLRGTHRHEDHAGLGAAMSDELIREEMELMKSIGINFIRLGHYQQNRTVLNLCDELGILVWEEIPWCRGGLGGEVYKEQARRMLRNMISQHRHHPSVIIWGLGNENDWPGDFNTFDEDAIREFMKELHELSHELDPSRKTAIRRCEFCADVVDVYSPSIWAGWYRGKFTDYQKVSYEEMQTVDHFLHVEWGASHHARRHSENPDKGLGSIQAGDADERAGDYLMSGGNPRVSKDGDWTETYACNLIDWHLKEQEKMDWLTGTAYWPFKDFSTPIRPDNPVPYVNQKGIVERDLTPKESFYVFQSYWTEEPMIHIYGHGWPVRWGEVDEQKMVKVYSNCGSAELFLNGKSLGKRDRNSQDYPSAGLRWVTPFVAGKNELRVKGFQDGKTVMDELVFEYQTEPWLKPAELRLELISKTENRATAQVYALDKNGVRCLDANDFVEFSLVGTGELIADLGTSATARKVQLYNGRAEISLKINSGKSVVTVESPGLPMALLTVE